MEPKTIRVPIIHIIKQQLSFRKDFNFLDQLYFYLINALDAQEVKSYYVILLNFSALF